MIRFRLLFALTLLFLMVVPAFAQMDAQARLLPVGAPAPDFTALAWGGGGAQLSSYRGKIVVLDFWAPWCGPCNLAMPHLQAIHDAYHDDNVVVVGLCVDDTPANATVWINSHRQDTFTFLLDPAGRDPGSLGPDRDIADHYGIVAIPTTYILDQSGVVAARGVDMRQEDIAAAVERLGARSVRQKQDAQQMSDDIKQADAAEAKSRRARAKAASHSRSGAGHGGHHAAKAGHHPAKR